MLQMMFTLKNRRPDLLDTRVKKITLRNSLNIKFVDAKSNYDLYGKSPFVRGCNLWKKLPVHMQTIGSKKDFNVLLTPEVLRCLNNL